MEPVTTQQLIFQYLYQHPQVTPHEISAALHLCVGDVRYHLHKLITSGKVEVVGIKDSHHPGRPARCYQVIQPITTNTLVSILSSFIQITQSTPELLTLAAGNLLPPELQLPTIPVIRISRTIQFLNSLGYEARWESRPGNPLVELRVCPYQVCHPESSSYCQLDQAILETGTGFRCNILQAKILNGSPNCLLELVNT